MTLKVKDNVFSLKRPNSHICTIIQISPELGREYFVLAPMTARGWPSISQRNWEYYNIHLLAKLEQVNKYPTLLLCPTCNCANKILNAPLRRISIYDNKYQCKKCKKTFIL